MGNPSRQPESNGIEVTATLKSRGEERTDFESRNSENYQNMADIVSKNRQDANLTTQINLHETISGHNNENNKESQLVDMSNGEDNESDDNTEEQWPNYLPEHKTANKSDVIERGKSDNGSTVFIQTASIINAYDEIISWKKLCF